MKSSWIILSPRPSKNDLELYLISYLERSTTNLPVASAPVEVAVTVTGSVTGFVIPLIVRSPVTSYKPGLFTVAFVITKVAVGNFSVEKNLLISSDRLIFRCKIYP